MYREKEYALIVAGGQGKRIPGKCPKQFLNLLDKPLLMYTIEAFYLYSPHIHLIVILPENKFDVWKELCHKHQFHLPMTLAKGGPTRFQSVYSGLQCISTDGLVAIHDGARPLVTSPLIEASFKTAALHQTAVAAVRPKDSIRTSHSVYQNQALDRSRCWLIQTPQTFRVSLIKKAYQIKEESSLTDDATVVEKAGHTISLFEGSYSNLKITTPHDLILAEAMLKNLKQDKNNLRPIQD